MNNYTKEDVQFLFQKLDHFIEMDDEEFNSIKDDQIEYIRQIKYLIEGNDIIECEINLNFINTLKERKRELSRSFGNVVLLSSEMASSGNIELALEQLDKFINNCSSPFFIKQAKDRKIFLQKNR